MEPGFQIVFALLFDRTRTALNALTLRRQPSAGETSTLDRHLSSYGARRDRQCMELKSQRAIVQPRAHALPYVERMQFCLEPRYTSTPAHPASHFMTVPNPPGAPRDPMN